MFSFFRRAPAPQTYAENKIAAMHLYDDISAHINLLERQLLQNSSEELKARRETKINFLMRLRIMIHYYGVVDVSDAMTAQKALREAVTEIANDVGLYPNVFKAFFPSYTQKLLERAKTLAAFEEKKTNELVEMVRAIR